MTLTHLLDRNLEEITVRSFPTLWARLFIGGVSGIFLLLNRGEGPALAWIIACALSEGLVWAACRPQRHERPSTANEKLRYLGALAFMNLTWSSLGALFWLSGGAALVLAGGLILATQVVHAVAFTGRSRAAFGVVGGIPMLALVALVVGGLGGPLLEHMTAAFAALIFAGYAVLSASVARREPSVDTDAPHQTSAPSLHEVKSLIADLRG